MDDPKGALNAALKDAMKNKDTTRRDAIRLLTSAIKQVEIDDRKDMSAEDVMKLLQKEAKKRRESISELEAAGRDMQAEQEKFELSLIEEFLPEQLSREELMVIVKEAIEQTGASSQKDMGKIMGVVMPKVKGQADGKLINEVARELLS